MAPYFAGSFEPGTTPEQIVVRTNTYYLPDLLGTWYLGVYNNELTNDVAFTIRAITPVRGLLPSAFPTVVTNEVYGAGYDLLSWYSIEGEWYEVSFTDNLSITYPVTSVLATTPVSTSLVPAKTNGTYFVTQVLTPPLIPPTLTINVWTGNTVRISWPESSQGFILQSSPTLHPPAWTNVASPPATPVVVIGNQYVIYDVVTAKPKYLPPYPVGTGKSEAPKAEIRRKSEGRSPEIRRPRNAALFGFRISAQPKPDLLGGHRSATPYVVSRSPVTLAQRDHVHRDAQGVFVAADEHAADRADIAVVATPGQGDVLE